MFKDTKFRIDTVILKRFQYHMQQTIPEGILLNIEAERLLDHMSRDISIRFKAQILGERLDRVLWKMPANWVEAVKERFSPKWLLKRYPVKYMEFKIDPVVLYPNIAIPEEKHYIRYERVVEDNG